MSSEAYGAIEQEAHWVRQAQAGDTEAFASLVTAHRRFVYNLIIRTVGNRQEAEDLTQEAFLRAWIALPRFRQQAKFRTWLYRIATNLVYSRLPKLRRELAQLGEEMLEAVPAETSTGPVQHIEADELRTWLYQAIEVLPASFRLLIVLRYQYELSYQEIVEVTSLPLGTVKVGLHRAKKRLRTRLERFEAGL